jgi:hypothetical protein
MECDKDVELSFQLALLEVERDPSLLTNTLVNTQPDENLRPPPKKKNVLSVVLDGNFLSRVPDIHIRHSTELQLWKRIAQQEETISLLTTMLDSVIEQ